LEGMSVMRWQTPGKLPRSRKAPHRKNMVPEFISLRRTKSQPNHPSAERERTETRKRKVETSPWEEKRTYS